MKHSPSILKTLSILLAAALFAAGCQPALAEEVTVEETAPDVAFGGPSDADFVTVNSGGDMTTLYTVPTTVQEGQVGSTPTTTLPIQLEAASGQETRLGVDVAAVNAQAEREGWSPWVTGAVIVAGVVVAGVATWAIIEACNDGSHDGDSSSHATVTVGGQNNTVTVNYDNRGGGYTTSSESRSEYK